MEEGLDRDISGDLPRVVQGAPVGGVQGNAAPGCKIAGFQVTPKRFCVSLVGFVGFIFFIATMSSIHTLKTEDQLVTEAYGEKAVLNGPGVVLSNPFHSSEIRQARLLGPMQYAIVKSTLTGQLRTELGPKLLFLGAYDETTKVQPKIVLKQDEFAKLVDQETGHMRVVTGAGTEVPGPTENAPAGVQKGVFLTKYESVRLSDSATGKIRVVRGEKLVFPEPFETMEEKQSGIRLSKNEWVRIVDKVTGKLRVERGEQVVFLDPMEQVVGASVNKGVEVHKEAAVLVLSKESGQQRLVREKGVFIPGPYEEIVDVRRLIHVEPHEAVIVRDQSGHFTFHIGSKDGEKETSFFLEPYHEVVEMTWTSGELEGVKDTVTKIDLRAQSVKFDYKVRTSDNVELRLKGIIFWQVKDVPKMIKATNDPRGNVWHRARSILIQSVSKSKLADFMNGFNSIVAEAFKTQSTDGFYLERGVEMQSMEVTSFECVDEQTAKVLQEIIQETTNRMNRLSQAESENEVKMFKMQGQIE